MSMTGLKQEPTALVEALTDHLHSRAESERGELARELHDNLGGLMVASMMDLSWAQQHPTPAPDMQARLTRVSETLRSAIDLKRQLVERLQPSLLREVGLYSALSWLMRSMCTKAGVDYEEDLLPPEPSLVNGAPIEVYRLAQEGIEMFIGMRQDDLLVLTAKGGTDAFELSLTTGIDAAAATMDAERRKALYMSMLHRARRMHAELHLDASGDQARLQFRLPLQAR